MGFFGHHPIPISPTGQSTPSPFTILGNNQGRGFHVLHLPIHTRNNSYKENLEELRQLHSTDKQLAAQRSFPQASMHTNTFPSLPSAVPTTHKQDTQPCKGGETPKEGKDEQLAYETQSPVTATKQSEQQCRIQRNRIPEYDNALSKHDPQHPNRHNHAHTSTAIP